MPIKTGTKYFLVAITVALVLAGLWVWYVFYPPVTSDVACLDPRPWKKGVTYLEVRVDDRTNSLLLRLDSDREGPAELYEYRGQERQFARISQDLWDEATGQICSSFTSDLPYLPSYPRIIEGALWYGEKKIPTAGHTAVKLWICTSGKVMAVLSAAGWERPTVDGVIPFSHWGGGYAGQHYVQFFTLPELERMAEPVRIPLTTADGITTTICSAGDEYVVYTGMYGLPVCVIPTGIEGQEQ